MCVCLLHVQLTCVHHHYTNYTQQINVFGRYSSYLIYHSHFLEKNVLFPVFDLILIQWNVIISHLWFHPIYLFVHMFVSILSFHYIYTFRFMLSSHVFVCLFIYLSFLLTLSCHVCCVCIFPCSFKGSRDQGLNSRRTRCVWVIGFYHFTFSITPFILW